MAKKDFINEITSSFVGAYNVLFDLNKKRALVTEKGSTTCAVVGDAASRDMIEAFVFNKFENILSEDETKAIVAKIKAWAKIKAPKVRAFRRAAKVDGKLIIDPAQSNEMRITLTREGVSVEEVMDIYFVRDDSMVEMPDPVPGGEESDLRALFNTSDADWKLVLAWMTYVIYKTPSCEGAIPLLNVHAPKGSGKSTLSRMLVDLLDPQVAPVRVFPDSKQDLVVALSNTYLVNFDNLRKVRPSTSDVLCVAVNGAYVTGRELYSNSTEHRVRIKNAIIINGIHHDLATEMDLISRMILMELKPIDDSKRRTDAEIWTEFNAKRGLYLGILFEVVSKAMACVENVTLDRMGRMADFSLWGKVVEVAMGWPEGSFMVAYEANQKKLQKLATTEDLLVQTVSDFLDVCKGYWKGTPAELLDELNSFSTAGGRNNPNTWPQTPAATSRRLEAKRDALEINDVDVLFFRSKLRQIELRRIERSAGKEDSTRKVVDICTGAAATVTSHVRRATVIADEIDSDNRPVVATASPAQPVAEMSVANGDGPAEDIATDVREEESMKTDARELDVAPSTQIGRIHRRQRSEPRDIVGDVVDQAAPENAEGTEGSDGPVASEDRLVESVACDVEEIPTHKLRSPLKRQGSCAQEVLKEEAELASQQETPEPNAVKKSARRPRPRPVKRPEADDRYEDDDFESEDWSYDPEWPDELDQSNWLEQEQEPQRQQEQPTVQRRISGGTNQNGLSRRGIKRLPKHLQELWSKKMA